MKRAFALASALLATMSSGATADDSLRAAVQNPISSLVSVPLKFSFDNGAPNGKANFVNLQPVIPVTIGDWTLINRLIIPFVDAPGGITGLPDNPGIGDASSSGRTSGLGDINYTLFFSPAKKTGNLTWGIGPSITAPTATDDRLGSGKWSGGLSAVALVQPEWGTYGGLVRHLWSFAGDKDRRRVNQTLVEPFLNYNLDDGWYLLTDSVITYDWEAASGQKLTLPVGGGFGRLFMVGEQAMNARTEAYYNVIRPDSGPKWTIGFTVQWLFPKWPRTSVNCCEGETMIGHTIDLEGSFDDALDRVTEALAAEGFGVITRIDMDKTFQQKLGVDFRRYVILGACNPQLAHRAVSDAPEIGLLLPCNVTVEATNSGTRVRLLDAERMIGGAGVGDSATLAELAKDAGARLTRVAKTLARTNQ